MPILALLASPLLGPAVWDPIIPALQGRRWQIAPPPALPQEVSCPQDVLTAFIAALPADHDVVLVAHSNAGLFVPLVSEVCPVAGLVFVDAGLPPISGRVPMADPRLLPFLAGKADENGLLPPWTQWWDPATRDGFFPNVAVRKRVEREQHRLPLSYFTDQLQIPSGWNTRPACYLSFGDTYASERQRAAAWGWSVRRMTGGHLHLLVEPDSVAGAIDDLLCGLGIAPEGLAAPLG